ncbi:MAG: chitosanase [Chloroflexi bacterium]|nr:chitosanase [Chloroflexota bacterium]
MSSNRPPATATVRRDNATINVRSGPQRVSAPSNVIATLNAGTSALPILAAQADARGENSNNKVYQWFQVRLPDSRTGWVRDDLVDIVGDLTAFGYGVVPTPTQGFKLTRGQAPLDSDSGGGTLPAPAGEAERVRKAAFNITSTFEGGGENAGYTMYQNHASDAGVVSFGRFQFTLAAGTLARLLERYLESASSETATQLRTTYLARIKSRDATLRTDETLKTLLRAAGAEQPMRDAQNWLATEVYWAEAQKRFAKYGLQTPLAQALIFDMLIHHGQGNLDTRYIKWVLDNRGLPASWQVGQNGVDERTFITWLAERRRSELDRQATKNNAGGLRVRGDFWWGLVERGDWMLQGDDKGVVTPKSGRTVNVRAPL